MAESWHGRAPFSSEGKAKWTCELSKWAVNGQVSKWRSVCRSEKYLFIFKIVYMWTYIRVYYMFASTCERYILLQGSSFLISASATAYTLISTYIYRICDILCGFYCCCCY